jgi:hypothetical protein
VAVPDSRGAYQLFYNQPTPAGNAHTTRGSVIESHHARRKTLEGFGPQIVGLNVFAVPLWGQYVCLSLADDNRIAF